MRMVGAVADLQALGLDGRHPWEVESLVIDPQQGKPVLQLLAVCPACTIKLAVMAQLTIWNIESGDAWDPH